MNGSFEEDADLRDLVAHALESKGILGKIKVFWTQLRRKKTTLLFMEILDGLNRDLLLLNIFEF